MRVFSFAKLRYFCGKVYTMKEGKTKTDLEELLLKGPTKPEARRESDRERDQAIFLTGVSVGCVLALVAFILMIEFLR